MHHSPDYGLSALFGILEFQKLWRSIPVDSMDEEKIEEYLKRQGISSMQEAGPKKIVRDINYKSFKWAFSSAPTRLVPMEKNQ